MELILASTSEARRALLDAAGFRYRALPSHFDESSPEPDAARLVEALALGKAGAVAREHPQALVIGADQAVELQGEIFKKPADAAAAAAQLRKLAGSTHRVLTGVALVGGASGIERVAHEVTEMSMAALGEEELAAYVRTGEWQGCAGAYRVEGRGMALFSSARGDLTNVRGLPMFLLMRLLREAGFRPLVDFR